MRFTSSGPLEGRHVTARVPKTEGVRSVNPEEIPYA